MIPERRRLLPSITIHPRQQSTSVTQALKVRAQYQVFVNLLTSIPPNYSDDVQALKVRA